VTSRPALIVAPHPDDELFGAGGLIAAKRAIGANVNIVYLTGGENSHRGCCAVPAEQVAAHRRQLAILAMAMFGVAESSCRFMGLPDGSLPGPGQPGFGSAVSALAGILADLRPAEVYCTHSMEGWPDHVAASAVTRAAVRLASPDTVVYEYLVWAPLNRSFMDLTSLPWRRAARLTIGSWAEIKAQAIRSYLSGTAACGHPWVGQLPQDFLRFFDWPYELFFSAQRERITEWTN
jgi:LmbE family N-acetylglucosaminyl deacetylase